MKLPQEHLDLLSQLPRIGLLTKSFELRVCLFTEGASHA